MSEPVVITFGCRLNAYESDVMRRHAADAGLRDCVIVNTCAVTGEAASQARQTIRKTRRERPNAKIIVTGCAAQIEPERFAGMTEVDHVVGNAEKLRADTFLSLARDTCERVRVDDIMCARETGSHMAGQLGAGRLGSRVRAYVQIQNGCDHRCTFCIIPFGRGPSRSVPAVEVVSEIRRLTEAGCREVVLTGVDITSYGNDLPGTPALGHLVRQVLKHAPELDRLRLSSIDVAETGTQLMDAIAEEPRLMPHLHLSLQSGDGMILKRMKRRHLEDDAIRFCFEARKLRPDIVFGADIIAGFPTETEVMFDHTLHHVEDCGLTYLHVFPFSPRAGTPAARMPQVHGSVIKERAARLRAKGDAALGNYLAGQIGREVEVLTEHNLMGHTKHFAEMRLDPDVPAGKLMRLRVAGHDGRRLSGEVVT